MRRGPGRLSNSEMQKEILKCSKDPVYFILNFVKISHPIKGVIPFKAYDFQKQLVRDFVKQRFNVVLKARQLGISTITAAYCCWLTMFRRSKEIMVVATKERVAAKLVKKTKMMIKKLPEWLKISKISIDNQTSFELENGSIMSASSTSSDAGRSESLSLLIVDEAAHVPGLDELWMAIYPTLTVGGNCILISSPNGVGNFFHKAYTEAVQKINDFYPTELKWDVHPDHDQVWFEKETANMSRRDIAQEHLCDFLMSGEGVFDPDDLEKLMARICEPSLRTAFDRNLWIWEEYIPGNTYVVVADVARGDGKDNSTFHIGKAGGGKLEIVAEYQSQVAPDMFSSILMSAGREYGNCMIVVENNTVGFAVLEKLIEANYPNIYFSTKGSHEYVEQYEAEQKNNTVAGFTTTSKTRPLIIAKMEEYVRNSLLVTKSSRLLAEMKTFVWENGRAQAMRSYNDDLVMAAAIACWVADTVLTINHKELEYKKAFITAAYKGNTNIDTKIPGMVGYKGSIFPDRRPEEDEILKEFGWGYPVIKG